MFKFIIINSIIIKFVKYHLKQYYYWKIYENDLRKINWFFGYCVLHMIRGNV